MVRAVRISPAHLILTTLLGLSMAACGGDGGGDTPDAGTPDSGSATCTTDDDCPSDQHCDAATMMCIDGTGDACAMDSECGDGRVCNTAVTDCGATRCRNACEPATCTGHADCGSWVCIEGACAEPPSCAGMACPGDLVCNAQQVCEPPTTCTADTDCTAPQICAGGVCTSPTSCTDSTQCPGGLLCQLGTCDDACTQDPDCGDTTMFTCETATGLCRARCFDDNTCDFGFICESLVCLPAQCTVDSDCTGANEECQGEENGHGRCVEVFACMGDGDCPDNFVCENMTCVELPACLTDRDCDAMSYCEDRHCQPAEACTNGSCAAGFDCVGDRCVPAVCRGDADCPNMGEVCVAGECLATPIAATVTDVRILTPAGTVETGATYGFTAVALDAAGDIVPGIRVAWASSDTNVAAIASDGVATAAQAGQTGIVASVDTGSMTVASSSVALTVLSAMPAGFRVVVSDQASGRALSGVTVICNAETMQTDASGVAVFDQTTPKTCSAFDPGHDYVTVFGLTGTSAQLDLPPLSRSDRSTGFTGTVDTSFSSSPVKLSFSGGSIASPLFGFTAANLLGGDVFTFDVPVVGSVAFPSGATASATTQFGSFDLKSTYYTRTQAGLRRSWTFAGGAELSDLGLGGGGNLLENLLPLFQTFRHGGSTGLETLVDIPNIVDSADINGNGDTTEMVPDYNGFVPKNLTPTRDQNLRFVVDGTGVSLPAGLNAVMLVGGVVMPRIGFVPLGLDGLAQPTTVGRFGSAMAAPYDGLEAGTYAVLVAAVGIEMNALPSISSTRLFTGATAPALVDLTGGFLALPTAAFDDSSRGFSGASVAGADAWHARFESPTGGWHVFGADAAATLPAAPMGFEDRSQGAALHFSALDLSGTSTLDTLFGLGVDADRTNDLVAGFSQQRVR